MSELRRALRSLLRTPGFTAIALGLGGIGFAFAPTIAVAQTASADSTVGVPVAHPVSDARLVGGATTGLLAGTVTGFFLGAAATDREGDFAALGGAVLGSAVGSGIGAAIGANVANRGRGNVMIGIAGTVGAAAAALAVYHNLGHHSAGPTWLFIPVLEIMAAAGIERRTSDANLSPAPPGH